MFAFIEVTNLCVDPIPPGKKRESIVRVDPNIYHCKRERKVKKEIRVLPFPS